VNKYVIGLLLDPKSDDAVYRTYEEALRWANWVERKWFPPAKLTLRTRKRRRRYRKIHGK
jgi:hypothetical protein